MVKIVDKRGQQGAYAPSFYAPSVEQPLLTAPVPMLVPPPQPEPIGLLIPAPEPLLGTDPEAKDWPIEPLTVLPFGVEVLPASALSSLKARKFLMADLVIEPPKNPKDNIEVRVHNAAVGAYGYLKDEYGADNVAAVALTAAEALAETGSQTVYPDCSYLAYLVHIATQEAATPAAGEVAA